MEVSSTMLIYYFTEQYLGDVWELNDKHIYGDFWHLSNTENQGRLLNFLPFFSSLVDSDINAK